MTSQRKLIYYTAGLIALFTFAVYLPVLHNDFILGWDDDDYVINNTHIRTLNAAFLKWAFFDFYASNWHPLTWVSHALDYALWGLNPLGHHLTSIIVHALNTFIVVLLTIKLLDIYQAKIITEQTTTAGIDEMKLVAGGVTGSLFGIHPLHVESVVWVAERKDLLCAFFFLISLAMYMDYANEPRKRTIKFYSPDRRYLSSLGFFILAILSKPMAVSLPVVMLILDWHPFKRIASSRSFRTCLVEKIPFMVLASVSSVFTVLAQKTAGSMVSIENIPLGPRILVAVKSITVYLWKTIMPFDLIPFYPYPRGVALFSLECLPFIAIVTGITVICLLHTKKEKLWISAWGYFSITLIPVLGIVQVGRQSMADRYMYLPSLGPFFILALFAAWFYSKRDKQRKRKHDFAIFFVVVASPLVFFAYLTTEQISVWKNSTVFWNYIIEKEPLRDSVPYNNRALLFERAGNYYKAIDDYNTSIAVNPSQFEPYYNRAIAFENLGMYDMAVQDYNKSISLNNSLCFQALNNRGVLFIKMGLFVKAKEGLDRAIAINPNSLSYYNRGDLYLKTGNKKMAAMDFCNACSLGNNEGCKAYRTISD